MNKEPILEAASTEISEKQRHLKKVHEVLATKMTNTTEQKDLRKLLNYSNHRFRENLSSETIAKKESNNFCSKCYSQDLMNFQISKVKKKKKRTPRVELRKKCSFCGHKSAPFVIEKLKVVKNPVKSNEESFQTSVKQASSDRPVVSQNMPRVASRNTFSPGAQNIQKLMSARKKLNKDTGLLDFLMKTNSKSS